MYRNIYLVAGGTCSALAALAHLGCILFGAPWYRFFGAGEQMATMAEQGHSYPTIVTSVLVAVLLIWSIYAFSAAKLLPRLPLIKTALFLISSIYLARAFLFFTIMPMFPENSLTFWLVSSTICLVIGGLYAIGTFKAWPKLKQSG